jgi:integrase/recombinase XerC
MSQNIPHLEDFSADLRRQEVSARTIGSYALDLGHFWRWFAATVGDAPTAGAVTPTDIRDYRSYLLNVERRQPATVNRRLAALRRFFRWAKATGLVEELPTENVKGVTAAPGAPRWLEKREVDRLVRAVERHGNTRDLAVVLTLRHTGIRAGELADLALGDVEISERKGTLAVRSGQGGTYRVLPLNVDVRRALRDYLAVRPTSSSDALFLGQRGDRLGPWAVERLVGKYARLAGLEGVTPRTLRHSFGKHVLDAGEDLVTVARLLGHERLETTARYTTPSHRDLEQAVAKLEREGGSR